MKNKNNTVGDVALLDHISTAVMMLDRHLHVIYLNAATEQLFGVSARRTIGKRLIEVVNLPDTLILRLRNSIKNGQAFTDRQSSIEPHGQEQIVIDCAITPFRSEQFDNGLIVEMDSKDRPLRIARDEAMLTQQEHAKSLLRGLAHEIKNPLGGLRGAAQLLQKQLDNPELQAYTSIIIREADRLHNLIDRMLGPNTRPCKDQLNIHEVLEHVRKITLASAPKNIQIKFDYDPSIPEFCNDRDRLVQVLLNIAGNAVNALQDSGGTVVFRSRVHSSYTIGGVQHRLVAAIQISDDGPGVPCTLQDQIFYPMVSGTPTGTGLGLSIAQFIMNQLSGLIEFKSEPGHTVFTVLIPLEVA